MRIDRLNRQKDDQVELGLPLHPEHDEISGMMEDWYYHTPFEGRPFPIRSDPEIEAGEA